MLEFGPTYLVMMISTSIGQNEETGLFCPELVDQDLLFKGRENRDVVHRLCPSRIIVEHYQGSSRFERRFGEVASGRLGQRCLCVFVEDTRIFGRIWHFCD